MQLLSLSCVTQESGRITLRSQGLPSVPPFTFCLQRLLFPALLQRSEDPCSGHASQRAVLSWHQEQTIFSSQAPPAQMLSLHNFHSRCVLRQFDHLKAMGAPRVLLGGGSCVHGSTTAFAT